MNPPRPRKSRHNSNYLYLLPAFIFYILFILYPLSDTVYTSFTQWSGIGEKTWVGLENYKNNLSDKKITSSIKHSFILIIFYSFFPIIIGLGIAGMMVRIKVKGMAIYRAILFLPQILSMIVVGIAFQIEMKYKAFLKGFKIKEIPVIFTDRTRGTSKMSKGIISEAIFGVLNMRFKQLLNRLAI